MSNPQPWDYGRALPPQLWHLLDGSQASGKRQSPIEINGKMVADGALPFPVTQYSPVKIEEFEFTHQHLEIKIPSCGGGVVSANEFYEIRNLHIHTPAEHTLDGSRPPMEIHIVHESDAGTFTVIGLWLDEGAENNEIDDLIAVLDHRVRHQPEKKHLLQLALTMHCFSPDVLFPANKSYFCYEGSLTTPPCSENVTFFLFSTPITASAAQIESFRLYAPGGNDRPLQPLNGRMVWRG